MKKLIVLLTILLLSISQAFAYRRSIHLSISRGDGTSVPTTPHRTPVYLPIEVFYDDEANQVEVIGEYNRPLQIYTVDENLDIIGYSTTLNTIFDMPMGYHGLIVVRIVCDNWVATGKTEI